MKTPLIFLALGALPLAAATINTPFALEMRQRNSGGTNYISPNLYADIPPSNEPGLMLFTGAGSIECVRLGTGLSWTPRDPSGSPHGILNVTATGVQADWTATTGPAVILNKPTLFDGTWGSLTGKPTFATVATTGAYADLTGLPTLFDGQYSSLTGKPTLGTAAAQNSTVFATAAQGAKADTAVQPGSLATVATTGAYVDLTGKPALFSGAYTDLTGKPTLFSGAYADLTGNPTLGSAAATSSSDYATAAQGAKADTAVQPGVLAAVAFSGVYADLTGKPSLFSGAYADLTGKPTLFSGAYADLTGKPTLGTAAATAITDYATAAQGAKADTALQPAAIGVSVQAYSANLTTFATNGSAYYLSRSNHTGTQAASTITGLATVATTGAYADLSGKPTLGTAAAQDTSAFDAAGSSAAAQAFSIQRANHTGTQAISTVTGLQTAIDAKLTIPAGTTSQYVRGDGTLATLPTAPATYRAIGTVSGGLGRVTFTYPSFGVGVVPIVQAIGVKPTGSSVSYNTAIYGDPTDTTCTVETNTVNPTIIGILGSILIAQPAANGTKVHLLVTAP